MQTSMMIISQINILQEEEMNKKKAATGSFFYLTLINLFRTITIDIVKIFIPAMP